MNKVYTYVLWFFFAILSFFLLIYTYALFAPLKLDEQQQQITLYDCNGEILYESNFGEKSEWVAIDDIPQEVQDAFVAVEDKRFYSHFGFDPIRLTKAAQNNLFSDGPLQGGSTITQQFAKKLFLTNDQTFTRKIEEFFYAIRLEMHYSKQDILEGYLNTLYFGHGVNGIKEASSYFFGKEMEDLTTAELAMLVGIVNGPSAYSPYIDYENAKQRQETILQILYEQEVITKEAFTDATQEELVLIDHSKDSDQDDIRSYYIDAVLQEIASMNLTADHLNVETYFDPDASQALYQGIQEEMGEDSEMQVSAVMFTPFTNQVIAMAGGTSYTNTQYNRALYTKRQVASTIKPLLYYCALCNGFTPSTTFVSQPTTFQLSDGETYAPSNYGDLYPYKEISMINAIGISDNIYAIKTHLFLGEETLQQALAQYGITAEANASLALGTVSMSSYELGSIYNSFASEGLYAAPQMIKRIESDGQILYHDDTQMKQLLHRDESLVLSQLLTATYDQKNKTYSYPSLTGCAPTTKTAIKSGTSDWDSLVAGYNPQYTLVIWSGYDDNRTLNSDDQSHAKKIFQNTFNLLYADHDGPWYLPSDAIEEIVVDPVSGKPSSQGSAYWYIRDE